MSRLRALFAATCLLIAGFVAPAATLAAQSPIVLKDVLGREVTLAAPAQRVVLAQARHLPVLALIHPDPVSVLAGWSDELKSSFSSEYAEYLEAFPALARVPVVGRHTPDTFSVENTLAQRPDLVVLTAAFAGLRPGAAPQESAMLQRFAAAGVPVVIIDFFVDPLKNTVPSMRLLGRALGREEQAEQFIAFYEEHMARVARAAGQRKERPPVLVHAHAGSTDCCNSPGSGTFNDMITFAGGHNIGADTIRASTGQLSLEYINSRNPVVYVATGTGAQRRTGSGLAIGTGVAPDEARASLRRVIATQGLGALPAVREGNAHAIWHAFNDSPLHVVFIEALARWIDPAGNADIDPARTLDEINQRFLAVPMRGTFMIDLDEPGQRAGSAPG
ncbi:ABC transporter substrate-binding protein [Verticiella sediminum]|uniref:ABC transporter substrate-binding protein n=1 Tax=Verticiella sediminum TaxID=1247510 RepID=A0A556A5V5_9BURK|nr:ABC transporter substrate-binding protein [Verticiella sediminum]TSH88269.1 ABC transporter substrate-binding protein [Verticiella sediminum]